MHGSSLQPHGVSANPFGVPESCYKRAIFALPFDLIGVKPAWLPAGFANVRRLRVLGRPALAFRPSGSKHEASLAVAVPRSGGFAAHSL